MTSTRLIRLVPNHRRLSIGACKLPKILFLGSDSFSCAVLKELIARRELWDEIHVVTPPITRKGRGLKNVHRGMSTDPTQKSTRVSIERRQEPPSAMGCTSLLGSAQPSFPYFVPKELINQFPPSHCLNLHPSNLPLYRGPAPIQWQLADRVDRLGVTIQDLSPHGFDLGDVLAQQAVPLPPNTSYVIAESLLALIGATLMCKVLKNLPEVIETAQKQDPQMATKARKISQSDLTVRQDWNLAILKTRYLGMGHQVCVCVCGYD
ncbi:hypothetical protein CROQUDRAFT_53322 [Cronartium quercuum f. sp. fusiforme G11]|uniref:Formyl transferase N-terminal domain-containing protein n=1 Tax=Cronartium quercuum f. sp. fusiforme G11 TaxID=708437 RepID=A0A9P6N9V5_9BASI|nr:hypothetical protein CROQUDRAFT_53322 [Cronartium quercuum f. sp. fusiforme G11]